MNGADLVLDAISFVAIGKVAYFWRGCRQRIVSSAIAKLTAKQQRISGNEPVQFPIRDKTNGSVGILAAKFAQTQALACPETELEHTADSLVGADDNQPFVLPQMVVNLLHQCRVLG